MGNQFDIKREPAEPESESTGAWGRRVGFSGPLTPRVGFSGPLTPRRWRGNEDYVELTLDVHGDEWVSTHDITDCDSTKEAEEEEEGHEVVVEGPKSLSFKLMRQVSQGLKCMAGAAPSPRRLISFKRNNLDRTKSGATCALQGLHFMAKNVEAKGWSEVESKFNDLAIDGGVLPRSRFGQCIGMSKDESDAFAGELFDSLARKRGIETGSVTLDELHEFWKQITNENFDSRLQTFFDMVDKNADGRITEEEIREIIKLSASTNKLSKIHQSADEYAALIMEELDPNNIGYIEIYNLEMLLLQGSQYSTDLATKNEKLSKLLSHKLIPTKEPNPMKRWYQRMAYFLEDNWKRVWVMVLWIFICVGLFTWKFIMYKHRAVFEIMGYCVCTAKGAAETLKFNMALVLLPVCRNTITWLRSRTKLGAVVPFDDNINFHKVIATGIAMGVGLHAIPHLTCNFPRLLNSTDKEYEPMKPFFGDTHPTNYRWFFKSLNVNWTGVVMVVLMVIAYTLAQPWFRRNRLKLPKPLKKLTGFNSFWYSHHLFIIVYILFIHHGFFLFLNKKWYKKTTWMYLVVPITLYACERLFCAFSSHYYKRVRILKVAIHPGNVLALQMTKPRGFQYNSGQYIFVKCSIISSFEWHPFSITSAPGDDYLGIHIRSSGDWTSKLKKVFSKVCLTPTGEHTADCEQGESSQRFPRLLIDGPYGAPAQDYKKYEVVLLVGLGIGATPMISIVKDMLNNIRQQKQMEKGVGGGGGEVVVESGGKGNQPRSPVTSRVYFYWVTREEGSFEWFREVMNEVAEYDQECVIELHNYCSSVYEEGDARAALIAMLQSIHHAKNGIDIVSGTRVKTHFARPKWRDVFKRLALNHTNQRVGVFYCGASLDLEGELRRLAQNFSRKTTTKFDFHKENF